MLCPTVNSTREKGLIYDDTTFEMSYIFGATFTSSNKTVTNVKLDHSYDCNIDLSANRSVYYSDKADIIGGVGNKIILDKQDAVYVNGKLVKQGQGEYNQR